MFLNLLLTLCLIWGQAVPLVVGVCVYVRPSRKKLQGSGGCGIEHRSATGLESADTGVIIMPEGFQSTS